MDPIVLACGLFATLLLVVVIGWAVDRARFEKLEKAVEARAYQSTADMQRDRHWRLESEFRAVLNHLGVEVEAVPGRIVAKQRSSEGT